MHTYLLPLKKYLNSVSCDLTQSRDYVKPPNYITDNKIFFNSVHDNWEDKEYINNTAYHEFAHFCIEPERVKLFQLNGFKILAPALNIFYNKVEEKYPVWGFTSEGNENDTLYELRIVAVEYNLMKYFCNIEFDITDAAIHFVIPEPAHEGDYTISIKDAKSYIKEQINNPELQGKYLIEKFKENINKYYEKYFN